MSSWIAKAEHWRTVFNAAVELKRNPDPLFAELGRALHSYHIGHDRDALAAALESIAPRLRADPTGTDPA